MVTRHAEGMPQQALISKILTDDIRRRFEANFANHGGKRTASFISSLKRLYDDSDSDLISSCLALYASLPEDYRYEYESIDLSSIWRTNSTLADHTTRRSS